MPDPFRQRNRGGGAHERVSVSSFLLAYAGRRKKFPHTAGTPGGVQPSPMELDGTTVLVVEDDDDTREVMRAMLEMCGAKVLVAESAKTGLDAYLKDRPDAIVSDIAMPGEDGYWLVREGARHRNTRDVPAVVGAAFSRPPPPLHALPPCLPRPRSAASPSRPT